MELAAALIGALVGGLLTMVGSIAQSAWEQKRSLKSVKAAICAEIATLIEIARGNEYEAELRNLAKLTALDTGETPLPRFRTRMGAPNFIVFQANAAAIGTFSAAHAAQIVSFYQGVSSWLISADYVSVEKFEISDREHLSSYYLVLADALNQLVIDGEKLIADLAPSDLISHIVSDRRNRQIMEDVSSGR